MVTIIEALPEPAGKMRYTLGRLPHHESVLFALEYLDSIGLPVDWDPDMVIDWYFPLPAGMSWVSLIRTRGTIFLFRQDVVKHMAGNRRKFSTPLVRPVEGKEWVALADWPNMTPNIDPDTVQTIRDWLQDDDGWIDLAEWYKKQAA